MKITVEIDEAVLEAVQRQTGIRSKSSAIVKALEHYLDDERRRRLIARAMSGATDYSLSNEELEGTR